MCIIIIIIIIIIITWFLFSFFFSETERRGCVQVTLGQLRKVDK